MSSQRLRYPNASPLLVWMQLGFKTSEMLFASSQVIGHRTSRMAMAGPMPNARDRKEFTLMGQEKLEAATESAQAVMDRMFALQIEMASTAFRQYMTGATSLFALAATPASVLTAGGQATLMRNFLAPLTAATSLSGNIARVAQHGLKPIHSRATSNARRLGKP
ncbi:polyhydroxyalkanoate granule-associated phasin [Herbaspirillum sp. GCM10030257]|uniref:polyhydroxyalkanoate granule-associated phasin n=1 Tax=Herbaspirillum sp. GCM10030257 TaxID=3273393 RepID=UPI0036139AB5